MQLDDVVHSSVSGPRLAEATHRFILTVDDCIVVMLLTTHMHEDVLVQLFCIGLNCSKLSSVEFICCLKLSVIHRIRIGPVPVSENSRSDGTLILSVNIFRPDSFHAQYFCKIHSVGCSIIRPNRVTHIIYIVILLA